MKTLRTIGILATLLGCSLFSYIAQADVLLSASASGNQFGDSYGFMFQVANDADASLFHVTLTNTSPDDGMPTGSDPLIDLLAFNLSGDPVLGTDFDVTNVMPVWTFSAGSGGIQFDYVGERTDQNTRLGIGDSLTFDLDFTSDVTDPQGLFLNADSTAGTGIGGGTDVGQVAVSFQTLGLRGNDSDLLATNYLIVPPSQIVVPEPGILAIFSLGLVIMGSFMRGRKKS